MVNPRHQTLQGKDNQLQAWNSPVEYPSMECKHDIKESKGNMFNPIFKQNVQMQKHPGSICRTRTAYVKKALSVDQKVINGHENFNDSHNYHDENHDEIEFYLLHMLYYMNWLTQEGGSLIAPMALAHPLHPIDNRSRNRRRNLWVGWCVSSWWPLFPSRSSVLIYIYM